MTTKESRTIRTLLVSGALVLGVAVVGWTGRGTWEAWGAMGGEKDLTVTGEGRRVGTGTGSVEGGEVGIGTRSDVEGKASTGSTGEACLLVFEGGAWLEGVRVAEDEGARRKGLRGTSGGGGAMLFRWTPARGRTAMMRGVEYALEIAWLGVEGNVVGMETMREGGQARYRFDGWTSGAIEAGPGVMGRAGVGVGSRVLRVQCRSGKVSGDLVWTKKGA